MPISKSEIKWTKKTWLKTILTIVTYLLFKDFILNNIDALGVQFGQTTAEIIVFGIVGSVVWTIVHYID